MNRHVKLFMDMLMSQELNLFYEYEKENEIKFFR